MMYVHYDVKEVGYKLTFEDLCINELRQLKHEYLANLVNFISENYNGTLEEEQTFHDKENDKLINFFITWNNDNREYNIELTWIR